MVNPYGLELLRLSETLYQYQLHGAIGGTIGTIGGVSDVEWLSRGLNSAS